MASDEQDRADDLAPPPGRRGRLRLRTLVLIRWVALTGQAVTLAVVHYGLGFALPIQLSMTVVAVSALANVAMAVSRPAQARLGDREGALALAFDILQLSLLLFLTGGLENPFTLLILAPLVIAAAALSRQATIGLCALALICITGLAVWHLPLPWPEPGLELPATYVAGLYAAILVAVLFITAYTRSVAQAAQRMADALATSRLALAREQRLSALGGLAAAAAHELGSPLATIAVVAGELERELPADGPHREDVALLKSQSQRCADILERLIRRPEAEAEAEGGAPFGRLALSTLVEAAVRPHLSGRQAVEAVFDSRSLDGSPEPWVARAPEILQGLGAIADNAGRFAAGRVDVDTRWDRRRVEVEIADDGPGFDPAVLGELGEPDLARRAEGGHLGLGVFIARTLLERTGARLAFRNRPAAGGRLNGGAQVAVHWPRAAIELEESRQ